LSERLSAISVPRISLLTTLLIESSQHELLLQI
jgi:hypothetical protein